MRLCRKALCEPSPAGRKKLEKRGPLSIATVREGVGVQYTVARILKANYSQPWRDNRRADKEGHGCERWLTYVPQFKKALYEELTNQKVLLTNLWKGIPIKTTRSSVFSLKQKACYPEAKKMANLNPRKPAFPMTDCGNCVELMRDLSIDWHRTAKRDRAGVSMAMDRVCEDIDLRHATEKRQDLGELCEEMNDPDYLKDNGVTAALEALQSLRDSPLTMAAVLAQKVCVDKASVCSKRNLQNIAQSITMKEARGMFVSGMMSTGAEYDGWAPSGSAATKKKEL